MYNFKLKSPAIFPKVDKIKDEGTKEFGEDLAKIITKLVRDILDDQKNLEKIQRVDTLPSASADHIGKLYILNGTGSGSDTLYINVDTGGGGYGLKTISLT
jgi:hypothetical protein